MRLFGNKGLVSNPFIVDTGGATIVCGGGGAGLVTLGGPVSGDGTLDVSISSGGVTLTNSGTTVAGLTVSARVVTLQDLGRRRRR